MIACMQHHFLACLGVDEVTGKVKSIKEAEEAAKAHCLRAHLYFCAVGLNVRDEPLTDPDFLTNSWLITQENSKKSSPNLRRDKMALTSMWAAMVWEAG